METTETTIFIVMTTNSVSKIFKIKAILRIFLYLQTSGNARKIQLQSQWLKGRFGSAELEEMMRDVEKDIVKIKALLQKKKDVFFLPRLESRRNGYWIKVGYSIRLTINFTLRTIKGFYFFGFG